MQTFINEQIGYGDAVGAVLPAFGADLQKTFPAFESDLGMAGQALMTGDFHGAVQDIPRAALRLFLTGVDISNLSSVKVEGPIGDLIPLSSLPSEVEQSFVNLLPPGSIPEQIAQNFVNGINTSALPLGFALIGPPIAGLDGLATGATAFGAAVQTGNGVAALGALVDMPAYGLNGFLNGETIVDLTVPVTETVDLPGIPPLLPPISIGPNTPVVIHLPFDGILTPPQPITATLDVSALGYPVPFVDVTFGGTQFGGMFPELVTRPDLQVFLPPIGGTTAYLFGDVTKLPDHRTKITCRVHDECNGSDVFGSDICTCRPYLIHGIEECARAGQSGGLGIIIYNRKEGRALGEVTKFLVYNARKRQEGGDAAAQYFERTECVAGVQDARFQQLMPDVVHWLGLKRIDRFVSMSDMKHDALTSQGIEIVERVPIPDDLVPADAHVEIAAKKAAGYYTPEPPKPQDLDNSIGRPLEKY